MGLSRRLYHLSQNRVQHSMTFSKNARKLCDSASTFGLVTDAMFRLVASCFPLNRDTVGPYLYRQISGLRLVVRA